MDGLRHSTMFTLRLEPQVIQIKPAGANAVHNNCVRCHENLIRDYRVEATSPMHRAIREGRRCVECHREVPHGRVNSLSSVPFARVPTPESPVPLWMKRFLQKN
jgi:cytochrome c nitrite reductase small subunit